MEPVCLTLPLYVRDRRWGHDLPLVNSSPLCFSLPITQEASRSAGDRWQISLWCERAAESQAAELLLSDTACVLSWGTSLPRRDSSGSPAACLHASDETADRGRIKKGERRSLLALTKLGPHKAPGCTMWSLHAMTAAVNMESCFAAVYLIYS